MVNVLLVIASCIAAVQAQTITDHHRDNAGYPRTLAPTATKTLPKAIAARDTGSGPTAAVTGCHQHGSDVYCIESDGHEVSVSLESTPTGELPSEYTGCHSHGEDKYCIGPDGDEVQIIDDEATSGDSDSSGESDEHGEGVHCHFHAGVEHCVGGDEDESESDSKSCTTMDREYNLPLRIGTLFVVLVTSAIGVFVPMLLAKLPMKRFGVLVFTVIKQFGTGVIMSTAFVHLATHANLMFTNDCVGELEYEATSTAIIMAGIFLSFLVEYVGHRMVVSHNTKKSPADAESESHSAERTEQPQPTFAHLGHSHGTDDPTCPDNKFSVLVMEAGVLFHSVIIGVTLVVAGDSFYRTLLVVIVFHQFFEGLALGSRIASLPTKIFPSKALMGLAFALITPIGMAIGMGVLHSFNGNDRSTLIALGTLDALSAGILVWVGVVDMWARDWVIEGGGLVNAGPSDVAAGGIALIAGMVLMGLLGKWA